MDEDRCGECAEDVLSQTKLEGGGTFQLLRYLRYALECKRLEVNALEISTIPPQAARFPASGNVRLGIHLPSNSTFGLTLASTSPNISPTMIPSSNILPFFPNENRMIDQLQYMDNKNNFRVHELARGDDDIASWAYFITVHAYDPS